MNKNYIVVIGQKETNKTFHFDNQSIDSLMQQIELQLDEIMPNWWERESKNYIQSIEIFEKIKKMSLPVEAIRNKKIKKTIKKMNIAQDEDDRSEYEKIRKHIKSER